MTTESYVIKKRRVLMVGKNANLSRELRAAVDRGGWQVEFVADLPSALKRLQEEPDLDVLFCDPATRKEAASAHSQSLLRTIRSNAEQRAILLALGETHWNRKEAARLLKISYRSLLYKIEQYHLQPQEAGTTDPVPSNKDQQWENATDDRQYATSIEDEPKEEA
jgi:two-component system response regulator AtoC